MHSSFHSSFLRVSNAGEQFLGIKWSVVYLWTTSPVGIASATADPPSVLKSSPSVLVCCSLLPGLPLAAWCQLSKGTVIMSGGQLRTTGVLSQGLSFFVQFSSNWHLCHVAVPEVSEVSSVREFLRSWLFLLSSLNFLRYGLALDIAGEAVPLTDTVAGACSLL